MRPRIGLSIQFIFMLCAYSPAFASDEITRLISSAGQQYSDGNYDIAISHYEKAIALGSPKAMVSLSLIYRSGKEIANDDVLADKYLQEAIEIYKELAKNNDVNAQYELGNIYSYHARPRNKLEGYKWYLKAAKNNHMTAQYHVASILEGNLHVSGVARNREEAIGWYEKSAKQGNKYAAKKLDKINQIKIDYSKRVNTLWSTNKNCFEEGSFLIAFETDGNAYKVGACAQYGCGIELNEFGRKTHKGNYKDDPRLNWISDKVFETKINGKTMRFNYCLTK